MPAEKATALVLRVIDFSESSCIVTLFTREFGKIGALAKGGRRPKGPFESALDLLAICRVVFLPKSSDALDLLTEAKLERRFRPPDKSLAALYAGYYIAELVNELTDRHDPHADLFDLCVETLDRLSRNEDVEQATLQFELGALRFVGHQPALQTCAECGTDVKTEGRVAFGLLDGGTLCPRCRRGKKQIVMLSAAAWQFLKTTAAHPGDEGQVKLKSSPQPEVRAVMNRYLANLIGHPLKMHAAIGHLGNN